MSSEERPPTSIVPSEGFAAFKNEDDMITKMVAAQFQQGKFENKELSAKIKILCNAIIELIDKEHPIPKRDDKYHYWNSARRMQTDLFRMMWMNYAKDMIDEVRNEWTNSLTSDKKKKRGGESQ